MYVSIFQVKFFFSILNQIRILVKRDRFTLLKLRRIEKNILHKIIETILKNLILKWKR